MSYIETHALILTKLSTRQLQEKVIHGNASTLATSIETKSMTVRGWHVEADMSAGGNDGLPAAFRQLDAPEEVDAKYLYELYMSVTFTREDGKTPNVNELASVIRTLANRASQPPFGRWTLAKVDGEEYVMTDDDDISLNVNKDMIGYTDVDVPENWEEFFSHLFGRDPHISRIRKSIEAAIMSDWSNRFHCALVGPPGCGKSDICRSLQRALGEEAVMEYDATATTAAGAIKDLAEREILPRVLVVEEIEKADEKTLAFLLGLMDMRGEIRKTTARTTIQRDTKLLVIATVNNFELFEKLAAGALASRFANKIFFSRPSREQLAMILHREVSKIQGDERWIKPALDYCEEREITDPRTVISLALCGREDLITGAYQAMLAETAPPM